MATAAQRKHRSKWPEASCAVCERASTLRCSRCKAVRYCSARCQIVDWRMGHKQECLLPNVNSSSSSPVKAHNSNLADMSKSQESMNYNISDAFKSKFEDLHKILDEMESSLATHKSETEDARTSTSHPPLRGWPSQEIAILQARLEYVMEERDALRSEVELLKSELSTRGSQQWVMDEEENSGFEMNNSYMSPPALLIYLEQKLEMVLGQSSLTG